MQSQRHLFDIPESEHYLNCAYMSPVPRHVYEIGISAMARKMRPYSIGADDFFEPVNRLRSAFAELTGISEPDRIAVIPSVSYGMANVVKNITINNGHNIVVAGEQFPSNVYPWQVLCDKSGAELRIVPRPLDQNEWSTSIINSIDEQTAAVCMGHVHWADGHLFDLVQISQIARANDALMIVDGTQSVGALPFPMDQIKPDALVCAGYKWLMGPYTIGVAYYGPYFDDKEPIENNWINRFNSEDFKGLVNYEKRYKPGAHRYNMGECSHLAAVPMLEAGIRQILDWGIENIQEYCRSLVSPHKEEWESLGYSVGSETGNHLFGIRLPANIDLEAITGEFATRKVHVSLRGDAVRVSPHLYNTDPDLEALSEALRNAAGRS